MARLELAMLGPFRATLDGDPIMTFHYEKARALLAYLAAESGQAYARSALAGLLWPEKSESVARQNLSQALATLRRVLGESDTAPSFFVATSQHIQFSNESEHDFDTAQFLALLAQCEEHLHVRLAECDLCLGGLRQAMALYRGDFLEDLVVADATEFYEWVLVEQARFQQLVTDALGLAAGAYEERSEYKEALAYAQRRLELAPWQEESHRQVIRLLALDGRRPEALKQFEVCRRTMRAEMDVEPETETLALYERIRSGGRIERTVHGTPHNLQAQLTPLIGRESELATATRYLHSSDCRLLVVVGPGGSGKSRLAVEVAQRLLADYPDGVFLVSLTALNSVQSLLPAIIQAVGLNLYDSKPPAAQLRQHLLAKRILLVLDSFEHLLDASSVVSDLLRTTRHLRMLVTSRARLNLQYEQVIWLGGLEWADSKTVNEAEIHDTRPATAYPAVRLFVYQTRRLVPHFSPDAGELASIVRICRLVNGMPLSILLAASWTNLLDVGAIAERVSGEKNGVTGVGIDFLEAEWQDVEPRQRSMRTVLDHSWHLLDESGKHLLARLSIFRGEFSLEGAQQVAGASLRQLKVLVDRSLLERTQAGKHVLHEHLRQYAAERLRELAPMAAKKVGALHAVYYMQRLASLGEALRDHRQLQAMSEIAAEFENMRSAWQWSVDHASACASREHADIQTIADGLDALYHFLVWQFRLQEGKEAFEAVARCLQNFQSGQHRCVLAEVLTCMSSFSRLLGDVDEACSLAKEAQRLVCEAATSENDVRRTRALVLQELGHVRFGSMPAQAGDLWRDSLALFRDLDDQWHIAQLLDDLASAVAIQAEWDQVRQLYQEALQIQRRLGDHRGMVRSLKGLSGAADNRGQIEEAISYIEECIKVAGEMGDLFGVAQGEFSLAIEQMYLGRFADACSVFESAASIAEELGALDLYAWILHFLAWANINLGMYAQARKSDSRALSIFLQLGEAAGVAFVHLSSGESRLGSNEVEAARLLFEQSLQEFRQLGHRDGMCLALNSLAYTAIAKGNLAQAREYVGEAVAIVVDTVDYGPALGTIAAVSLLKQSCGNMEKAVELYALVSGHPYIGQSIWRHEVIGKRIAKAASTLPTKLIIAARQRGEACDWMATLQELDTEFRADD